MTWHPRQLGEQTGRTFIVTGANSGIGFETARDLVGRGAHVVLAVRDTTKGDAASARLTGPGSTSVIELDLADLDKVAACAKSLLDRHDSLSALICNAGVMGGPLLLTPQGLEGQMAPTTLVMPRWSPHCGRGYTSAPRASYWCRATRGVAGSSRRK